MADKYISLKTIMESPMRQFVHIHTGETKPEDWVISGADIMRIPTADVRPVVKSRWIEIDDYVLCANCGTAEHSPNRNFCHNCGCAMEDK